MKYLKKVDNDKFYVIPTNEFINYIHSRDHPLDIEQDLFINNNQRLYFGSKARFMGCVCYLPKDLIDILLDAYSDYIISYIYILHDYDLDIDGNYKKSHFHILLHLSNSYPLSLLVKIFKTINVECLDGTNKLLLKNKVLYLTHESDKAKKQKKYIYSTSDLVSNDLDYWLYYRNLVINDMGIAFNIISDLVNKVSYVDMVLRYGQNFIINFSKYNDFVKCLSKEEFNLFLKENKNEKL